MSNIRSESYNLEYHLDQWKNEKESTKSFIKFIQDFVKDDEHYLDLGCGAGAATYSLAQQFTTANWTGIDLDPFLVSTANNIIAERETSNLNFVQGDFEKFLEFEGTYGVVSLQTLSWLDDFRPTLANVFGNIKPNWLGVTSLFYEGDITAQTKIIEHKYSRHANYNTYSIPLLKRFANSFNYDIVKVRPFYIEKDINAPLNRDSMKTFTVKLEGEDECTRLQVSGPMLMNWYMIVFQKLR